MFEKEQRAVCANCTMFLANQMSARGTFIGRVETLFVAFHYIIAKCFSMVKHKMALLHIKMAAVYVKRWEDIFDTIKGNESHVEKCQFLVSYATFL